MYCSPVSAINHSCSLTHAAHLDIATPIATVVKDEHSGKGHPCKISRLSSAFGSSVDHQWRTLLHPTHPDRGEDTLLRRAERPRGRLPSMDVVGCVDVVEAVSDDNNISARRLVQTPACFFSPVHDSARLVGWLVWSSNHEHRPIAKALYQRLEHRMRLNDLIGRHLRCTGMVVIVRVLFPDAPTSTLKSLLRYPARSVSDRPPPFVMKM